MSASHKKILQVLIYIQENFDSPLTLETLAREASLSPFHFHRLFTALVGETVYQYVKRLRMEEAASRLRYSEEKVIDIAMDCGFDTPAGFTKAFQKIWGHSPREFRKSRRYVPERKPFPGKPALEDLEDMPVLFLRRTGSYRTAPEEAFEALIETAKKHRLLREGARLFGIGWDDPAITEQEKLRFDACLLPPSPISPPDELGSQVIRGGRYAVFPFDCQPEEIPETFISIYRNWLPESGYQLADRPSFCELTDIESSSNSLQGKIYLPVSS